MDAEPARTPLTDADVPLPDTAATPDALLDQVIFARSAALPPLTWAVNVAEPPTAIVVLEGETEISIACDGAVTTLAALLGSSGQAAEVNAQSTTTTRTTPRGVPR